MTVPVRFNNELIIRYGGRGPRYTSYPTALQFSDDFTVDEYRANATKSNGSNVPLSLYLHIPFCRTLCYYCGCNKIVTRNQQRVERYIKFLYREIGMQSDLFDSARKIEQLHFGGGTPTYLSNGQLSDLITRLGRAFTFDNSENREFSIEVDPRTVDGRSIGQLADLGFNRLSLGVQDFDPIVQKAVNRIQTFEDVSQLMSAANATGFDSISLDLIYGLPHQTVDSFERTLQRVVRLRPNRLSIYNYAQLPHRFKGQRMIRDADLPPPPVKLDILHMTIDKLCEAGYVYIGMDHFALPDDELVRAQRDGTLQRNFQGYSTHRECDLVALGVSAIGQIGNVFAQSAATTMEYEALIESGQLPIRRGLVVDDDDLLRADVIQSLMCYDTLSYDDFSRKFRIDFRNYFAKEIERLHALADDGLVKLSESGVEVTREGRLLLRSIAMVFDRYVDPLANDHQFSKAI